MSSSLYCIRCGAANQPQAAFCFACGQGLQVAPPLPQYAVAGSALGNLTGRLPLNHLLKQRYRIIGLVGKGGMGAVYKADDTLFHNRLVAVKEMSQSGLSPQVVAEAVDAFKCEAHMLANLDHQILPKIHDYFDDTGRWYLVMDFIQGETLDAYLDKKGGPLLLQQALDIGIQLCRVLDYLHSRKPPIVFRDLKPSNIMRTTNGEIYLIDFGIARFFKPGQAKDTVAYGSAGYAAPEQYGNAQTIPQSDIYSLGAVLHQLLSGHDPSTNVPNLFTFPALTTVPTALERLIGQMVQVNAADRPMSIAVVKQELQRIASPSPSVSSVPPTLPAVQQLSTTPYSPARPKLPARRVTLNRFGWFLVVVILVFIGLTTWISMERKSDSGASRMQAVSSSTSRTQDTGATVQASRVTATAQTASQNPYIPNTGTLVLDDPLHDNTKGYRWEEGERDGGYCTFMGGTYHTNISQNGVFHSCLALAKDVSDFTFEVQMNLISGNSGGIVFRVDRATTHLYSFLMDRNGTYSLKVYYDKLGNFNEIMKGTSAPFKGDDRIGVVAQGSSLRLYVNRQLVGQVNDNTYTHGQLGIVTLSGEAVFSNARVWML